MSLALIHVDGVRLPPNCGHQRAPFFIVQMIYEYGERMWNYTYRENLPQCHLIHHNPHMD
jgi:hypothetical protein